MQDCVEFYFDHEIEKLDFSSNGILHSVDVVNNWVANVTQNNIKDLISAQNLSPSTQLILVSISYSSIYFMWIVYSLICRVFCSAFYYNKLLMKNGCQILSI